MRINKRYDSLEHITPTLIVMTFVTHNTLLHSESDYTILKASEL